MKLRSRSALTALAKAYAWQEQLESGQFEDLEDIAKEQGVDRSYVGRMLQLTSLSPELWNRSWQDRPLPISVCGIFVGASRYLGTSNDAF